MFYPKKETFTSNSSWILIYLLLQIFWEQETLEGICNTLGRFVMILNIMSVLKYTYYTQFLLYMDLIGDLLESIIISSKYVDIVQTIDYENI